jgi:deazaflavin-dependent oxidoreductase (nitroreductase family)
MLFGKEHVDRYRATDGEEGHEWRGTQTLLLTTTGRRSGQRRTAPVLFQHDGENVVVIGSNAGNKEPGWSFNLKANPEAEIEIGPKRSRVRARVCEGDERERLWDAMNAQYEGFEDYDRRADRDIPVFVLEPR